VKFLQALEHSSSLEKVSLGEQCVLVSSFLLPQILACQGAAVSVGGIYPLVYPPLGYRGQLAWLGDTAACLGTPAYTSLLAAAKEGPVELPTHVEVRHCSGRTIHLGPDLLTPTTAHLKRTPSLSLTTTPGKLVVIHKDLEKLEKVLQNWDLQVPLEGLEEEVQRMEEQVKKWEEEEPDVDRKGGEAKKEEKKKEEEDDSEEEVEEEEVAKETEEDRERQDQQQREEDRKKSKRVFIYFDSPDITEDELLRHMEQYGAVEKVFFLADHAVAIMSSSVLAGSLQGRDTTLLRTGIL
jgi:hypothetical protein